MNKIHVLYPEITGTINPNIYGHFVEHLGGCIYDGIWVGQDSDVPNIQGFRKELVELFRAIKPPVLRWPGGCFAETYNWRDGIGPRDKRPTTVNWWYNYDKRLESNQVGTHEFMAFCELVGAKPYFAANATTTTALEIRNWIEYCNFEQGTTSLAKLREENGRAEPFGVHYWGLGNENWGGGGNMTPEDYCAAYRKYAIIADSVGRSCEFIACGPNGNDLDWTRRFFAKLYDQKVIKQRINGYSVHYYCGTAGEATDFSEAQWYELLYQAAEMETVITQQRALMDPYDPQRKIGMMVDEWGCWHKSGSGPTKGGHLFEQQCTMRDALVSAITLNIFNNHCDSVVMANAAQLVNCLHSLFLAQGGHLVATPTYYIFEMMKEHQGAAAIKTVTETAENGGVDEISVSASLKDGKTLLTIANTHYAEAVDVEINLHGGSAGGSAEKTVLAARPDSFNTFDQPARVKSKTETIALSGSTLKLRLPAASVTCIRF